MRVFVTSIVVTACLGGAACGGGDNGGGTGTGDMPSGSSGTTVGTTAPTDATGTSATAATGTTAATEATTGTTAATEATGTTAATDATGTTAATTGAACVDINGECCPLEQACGDFECCGEGMFCEVDVYCREKCNPLQPTCEVSNAVCVLSVNEELFYCTGQAQPGAAGDPCDCLNCCDLGHICLGAKYVQGCESDDCCAPFCDLSNPIACPGAMESCQALYTEGTAPAGYENVGICTLPA
jgi:hypothetical protein